MFAFVFLMPGLQSTLFCLAIGRDPTSLKLAIVNDELNPSLGRVCNYTTDCTYSMFSCRYLRFLDNSTIIQVDKCHCSSVGNEFEILGLFRFRTKVCLTRWMQRCKAEFGASSISVPISRKNYSKDKLTAIPLTKRQS